MDTTAGRREGDQSHLDPTDLLATLPTGIRLCYRLDGPPDGDPIVLIAGLGLDLTSWSPELVDGLVSTGHLVVRLDNRDAGRSSRGDGRVPSVFRKLFARPHADAYTLADMADDVCGLLDHLGIVRAHLVGMSMGGMIAQTVTARYPERVATLTSIFSTTGNRKVGQPSLRTIRRLARKPSTNLADATKAHLKALEYVASASFPPDEAAERRLIESMWTRGVGARAHEGVSRQISAIQASGDRTAELRGITAPTLVIHGDTDPLVHPSGGTATVAAIPGARFVQIPGMRHHLAPGVVDTLVGLISTQSLQNPIAPSHQTGSSV